MSLCETVAVLTKGQCGAQKGPLRCPKCRASLQCMRPISSFLKGTSSSCRSACPGWWTENFCFQKARRWPNLWLYRSELWTVATLESTETTLPFRDCCGNFFNYVKVCYTCFMLQNITVCKGVLHLVMLYFFNNVKMCVYCFTLPA